MKCKNCGDEIIVMDKGKKDEYWLCECGNPQIEGDKVND